MSTKLKTFDDVREFLSRVYCIHWGGCGVSAFAMYKWLDKKGKLNHHFKFVICYDSSWGDDDERYLNNCKVLRTKQGKAMAPSHIGISNDEKIIDCNGPIDIKNYGLIQFVEHEWFMVNMIKNIGSWNPSFNRDNVKFIETALNIDLSEIKEE